MIKRFCIRRRFLYICLFLSLFLGLSAWIPARAVFADAKASSSAKAIFASTKASAAAKADSGPSMQNIQTVSGGKFVKEEKGYVYYYADNTIAKDCILKIKKQIYYFSADGYRKYGWQKIDGDTYYFGKKSNGYLIKDSWVKGENCRYRVDQNGKRLHATWLALNGHHYYFLSNGKMCTGRKSIGGITYYFGTKGKFLRTGIKMNLSSDCDILINAETGVAIYGKNAFTPHATASTTKILTCILAMEKCRLDDKVYVSANAAAQEPTKLWMTTGQTFRLKDLLYSLMLPSHNDTAVAIAEHVSGSVSKFADLMNKKAKSLGCTSTHFVTPNGLDSGLNHYSTAADMAKIAAYAYQNQQFRTITNTLSYTFYSASSPHIRYDVKNINDLLGNMAGIRGMKSGYTRKAGQCFVGVIESKKGNTYISVCLGGSTSEERWNDSRTMLAYAYEK